MAPVSLDGLLEKIPSKFDLVMVTAKRARQIKDGAPKLVTTVSVNPVTIAMEEIYAGKIILEGSVARVIDDSGRALTPAASRVDDLLSLPDHKDIDDLGEDRLNAMVNELFGSALGEDDLADIPEDVASNGGSDDSDDEVDGGDPLGGTGVTSADKLDG